MNAIVILGTGFEEIEALAVVDILRRAGMTVQTAGIGGTMVTGSHGIAVRADLPIEAVAAPELLVLPGGLGGVQAMEGSAAAMALIERQMASDRPLGAICAAPSILGKRGWADGRRVTCYPGFETQMGAALVQPEAAAVTDGNLVTGRAPGAAIPFALALVERFCGAEARQCVAAELVWTE